MSSHSEFTTPEIREAVVEFSRKIGARGKQGYVVVTGEHAKMLSGLPYGKIDSVVRVYAPAAEPGVTARLNGIVIYPISIGSDKTRRDIVLLSRRLQGVRVYVGKIATEEE